MLARNAPSRQYVVTCNPKNSGVAFAACERHTRSGHESFFRICPILALPPQIRDCTALLPEGCD